MKKVFKTGFFYLVAFLMVLGNSALSIDFSIPVAHATTDNDPVTICHMGEDGPVNIEDTWDNHNDHEGDYKGECKLPEPETSCELKVVESDDGYDPIAPGDEIVYSLTVENIGDADCTNVILKDYFDPSTSYVTSSPAFNAQTSERFEWDFPLISVGSSEQVFLTMLVSEETQCDSTLENLAKYTYYKSDGWDTDNVWSTPVIEETSVICEEATYCGDGDVQSPNDEGTGGPNNDGYEECDSNGQTSCTTEDGYTGMKTCNMKLEDSITFTSSDVVEPTYCTWNSCKPTEFCGDGIQNGDEECDGGLKGSDSCTTECTIIEQEECSITDNILINSSFEEPEVTNTSLWQKMSAVIGWIIEKVSDNSATTLELHKGWSGNAAADGLQYSELDGDHSTSIRQSATTEVGARYKLFWSFAARHNISADQNQLAVEVNGTQVATNGPTIGSAPLTQGDWIKSDYEFIANDTNTEVSFKDIGPSDSYGTYVDDIRLCKIADPESSCGDYVTDKGEECDDGDDGSEVCTSECTLVYSPHCGDGEINQEWEQCEPNNESCTEQCQWEEQDECSDLTLARVNVDKVTNENAGTMTSDLFLGSDSYHIPQGVWFPVYWNGSYFLDDDITSYEDVEGLAVQRLENSLRTVMHTSLTKTDSEEITGSIDFYNANASSYASDNSGNNKLESPDYVNVHDGAADFYMWANVADDGFYTNWNIVKDCNEACTLDSDNYNLVLDKVDIGDTISENNHPINGWSIANIPGGYGGCQNGALCDYRQLIEDPCEDTNRNAETILHADDSIVDSITIRHLDGISLMDSFELYINGQYVDTWFDETNISSEEWIETSFDISSYGFTGDLTVKLKAIDDIWSMCSTYGQVAIDWISIQGCGNTWEPYSSYCGDGVVDPLWEQCDPGLDVLNSSDFVGCSQQCQFITPQCNDLVAAKINITGVENWGNGNMTSDIFLGSDSYRIPQGVWFPVYKDGNYFLDNDVALASYKYEDVPGLAVQRLKNSLRTVMHGTTSSADKEHVSGNIEFYNATLGTQLSDESNDYPGNNRLEDGFNGGPTDPDSGVYEYDAGNDEVWVDDGKSFYWLTTTTADDGFYTTWDIIDNCTTSICGVKFNDKNRDKQQGEVEENLTDWTINLYEKYSCAKGDEWADAVVEYNPGSVVAPVRTDSLQALGVAENDDTINFVSLGLGGELILKFDNIIENGVGDDIQVIETSFDNPTCDAYPEYVHVYASQDGVVWTDLGDAKCQEGDPSFDLGSLPWAKYVKLVDESLNSGDGFDVDGVKAINCLNVSSEPIDSETTTENGYCFEDLEAGYYMVCEEMQDAWINSTPLCQQVLIEEGDSATVDFGNYTETEDNIPVITLIGDNPINLTLGDTYTDESATADDVEDGDITSDIVTYNPVDTSTLGTYIVTYNVTDSDSNDAVEVTRTVVVDPVPCVGCGGGGITFTIKDLEESVSCKAFDISWHTTKNSDTILDLGTESGVYTININNDTNTQNHSLQFTDLLPDTTYYYKVRAIMYNGREISLSEKSFTTPPAEQCGEVLGKKIEAKPLICNFLRASGSSGPDVDVEGVFQYPNGSLLRDACDRLESVYLIKDQMKWHVPSWQYLHDYHFGQRIYNVITPVLDEYPDWTGKVLGIKEYADGTLLRGPDMRIYILENGHKKHIKTFKELLKYIGQEIIDVSDEVLDRY